MGGVCVCVCVCICVCVCVCGCVCVCVCVYTRERLAERPGGWIQSICILAVFVEARSAMLGGGGDTSGCGHGRWGLCGL